jgi:hypothetical protein
MIRLPPFIALIAAAALANPVAAQSAATPAPTPAATPASTPSAATSEPTKECISARKKADKEQRSLTNAVESIAKDTKGRESCSSKSMCERYDAAISAMEKRKARHETRLARFKDEVAGACKS